jgi:hypothetical protein
LPPARRRTRFRRTVSRRPSTGERRSLTTTLRRGLTMMTMMMNSDVSWRSLAGSFAEELMQNSAEQAPLVRYPFESMRSAILKRQARACHKVTNSL